MTRYWSRVVESLEPYVPGEQPKTADLVKLNTNESPYGPSPRALEAMRAEAGDTLRLYPDPESDVLRQAIAAFHEVPLQTVFVGNGSDEVLAHVFRALLDHHAPLLFPDVTYSFYPVYCRLFGIDYRSVPLTGDYRIDVDDYRIDNGGIILANPNAPTGIALARGDIERLLEANRDSVVVVDEAYVDFGAESVVPLTAKYDNLLVVQTLSKSRALAGLRVGFAIGDPGLVEALARVKNSFNSYPLSRFAQAGAAAAMADVAHFEETRRRVIASRERTAATLAALGFEVLPSAANFLFARHPGHAGAALAAALRERRVIVRHFDRPRIADFLRISIGTDAQCDRLVDSLRDILEVVESA